MLGMLPSSTERASSFCRYASTTADSILPSSFLCKKCRLIFRISFASLALEMSFTFLSSNWTPAGFWVCAPAMPP